MFFLKRAGDRFVQRVNPTSSDFVVGNFNWDGTWRVFDLSSVVPFNTKQVVMLIEIASDTVDNYLAFCPANSIANWDGQKVRIQAVNRSNSATIILPITTPQTAKYKAKIYSGIITGLEVIILGWWV